MTGDTLTGIAVRYGSTVSALVAANGITDPDLIRTGATLTIPAAGTGGSGAPAGGGAGGGLPLRLQQSPTRLAYLPLFDEWAGANGIPPDLLKAMTWLESGWQNSIVSPTGAMGIGQLMPGTVDHMETLIGVDLDPSVPEDNIRLSARFLRWLLARFATTESAVAAYYQGPASIERHGPFAETQQYVANVLALRARF
jgi:soluble lytic murein transglycosylase-like protein